MVSFNNTILIFIFSAFFISCVNTKISSIFDKECKIESIEINGEKVNSYQENIRAKSYLSNCVLDESNRIVYRKLKLNIGIYEYDYSYNSNNSLKTIIEKRYVIDSENNYILFITNTITYYYQGLNPVKIIKSCKVNNHKVGVASDYVTTNIINYTSDNLDSKNDDINYLIKITQTNLEGKINHFP